jgi:hypothetical protein
MVFLSKRGGRRLLFTTTVNDVDEIEPKVLSELEELKEDVEIKGAKHIIAIDTKNNYEVKIKNPYFEEEYLVETTGRKPTKEDLATAAQLEMLETFLNTYKQYMPELLKVSFTATADALKEAFKRMVTPEERKENTIADWANFINSLVNLAKHKDEVKALVQEAFMKMKSEGGGESELVKGDKRATPATGEVKKPQG